MRKLIVIFAVLMSAVGVAQDIKVQGKVLDGAIGDEPLAFANVKVKGLDISVETSIDGLFELKLLEGNYTFIIDFIGYQPIEIENVEVSRADIVMNPVSLKAFRPEYDLASIASGGE